MENKFTDKFCEYFDFDMATHPIMCSIPLCKINEGSIYRSILKPLKRDSDIDIKDLSFLIKANSKKRRRISALMSGHIVPFNITTKDCGWLFLLDCFDYTNKDERCPKVSNIVESLYANRIIPIISDGYLIS